LNFDLFILDLNLPIEQRFCLC